MLRPFSAVVLVIALVTCLSVAQQQTTSSPPSPKVFPVTIKVPPPDPNQLQLVVDLLQEGHTLLGELPMQTRLTLLARETRTMSSTRPQLAREWAEELFALAANAEGEERLTSQERAVTLMAGLDPERARELLHSMPPLKIESNEVQPKMTAARSVFGGLAARDGIAVPPLLEQEAELLAREGHYPYTAMMKGIVEAGFQQRRQARFARMEHEQAFKAYQDFVQQAFNQIAARYYGGTPTFADNVEFGQAIQTASYYMPEGSARPALRVMVKNLLATTTPETFASKVVMATRQGKMLSADNIVDMALLRFGPLINRIDPELALELQSTRPQLKAGLELTKDGQQASEVIGAGPRLSDPIWNTLSESSSLAKSNPDIAMTKLQQLPKGPTQTLAMLSVATKVAEQDPERAEKLITEIPGNAADDYANSRRMLSLATAAITKRRFDEFQKLCKEMFEMYRLRDPRKTPAGVLVTTLEAFVRLGAKDATDFTIDLVQKIPETEVKARLLGVAALGVRAKTPIMGGFPNVQKPAPAL